LILYDEALTRVLAISLALAGILGAANPAPPSFLLPDTAQPRRYAIDLTITPSADTFRGLATIDLDLKRSTSILWLNGKDLVVGAATLSGMPARAVAAGGEFLGFALPRAVGPGPARLQVRYRGRIGRNAVGIFHNRAAGDWYVFTTFTAIEARRAFPCFDEPRYKAPWELTLHVARGNAALGNTHIASETAEAGGGKRVVFAPTEPLPSSLVAFAVGPFEMVDAGLAGKNGVPVRIVTPRGRASEAAAAREAASRWVAPLEEYTGIPYPFEKLDDVALIEGAFGAIENPGLITYQQKILLAGPELDTPERRRQMRSTMAHELAHQWFGNLVTMADWEDVWLSEGFATWMGVKLMEREEPVERRGLRAVVARERVMTADGSPDIRRVREAMASRAGMRSVYSPLVYEKGAATLRMIEHWLGEDAFRAGVRRYLVEHRFGNATTADFVSAMAATGGAAAGSVLKSFFDQPGVPVIWVAPRCDPARPTVALRQDRYTAHGATAQTQVWNVPVCVKGDRLAARCVLMEGTETEIPVAACPSWVFANAGAAGYYRTLLGPGMTEALTRHRDQLTAAERLAFAQDVSALARNGRMPAGQAAALLPWLEADSEPLVVAESARLAALLSDSAPAVRRH
jgi:alanyl aminopeptidase